MSPFRGFQAVKKRLTPKGCDMELKTHFMKIIQFPRGYGKSIMAIHQAVNKRCPLIVKDEQDRNKINLFIANMLECANCSLIKKDCKHLKVYTFSEFMEIKDTPEFKDAEVVIDDFDELLRQYYGLNPDKLTITTK